MEVGEGRTVLRDYSSEGEEGDRGKEGRGMEGKRGESRKGETEGRRGEKELKSR